MSNEPEVGIENLEQAIALTDVPPLHPGPFKWFPDPYDAELRYGTLMKHLVEKYGQIHQAHLRHTNVTHTYDRDGVLIIFTEDGVCFYQGTDVAQGSGYYWERYVNECTLLALDGVVTKEEQVEIVAELKIVRENVAHRKAVLERRQAVNQLRVELLSQHTNEYQAAKRFLESPDISAEEIEVYGKALVAARKRIAKIEALGERAVFNRAKKARVKLLNIFVELALGNKPVRPRETPGGKTITFEGMEYTTQEELDLVLGKLYRLLRATEACNTPEELVRLEQP